MVESAVCTCGPLGFSHACSENDENKNKKPLMAVFISAELNIDNQSDSQVSYNT